MSMMRSIAVAENLKFVDGGAKMDKLDTPAAVINIGFDRGNRKSHDGR
jgi:hypothetical protein